MRRKQKLGWSMVRENNSVCPSQIIFSISFSAVCYWIHNLGFITCSLKCAYCEVLTVNINTMMYLFISQLFKKCYNFIRKHTLFILCTDEEPKTLDD